MWNRDLEIGSGKPVKGSEEVNLLPAMSNNFSEMLNAFIFQPYITSKSDDDASASTENVGGTSPKPKDHAAETERMKISPMGNTALHIAALCGTEECVEKIILKKEPCLLSAKNVNGDTALHVAAKAGHVAIIEKLWVALFEELYSTKANMTLEAILAKNKQGNTFFHEALLHGHHDVIKILHSLKNEDGGFKDLFKNEDGGFKDLIERAAFSLTNKEKKSVLHLAIEKGYEDIVDEALTKWTEENTAKELIPKPEGSTQKMPDDAGRGVEKQDNTRPTLMLDDEELLNATWSMIDWNIMNNFENPFPRIGEHQWLSQYSDIYKSTAQNHELSPQIPHDLHFSFGQSPLNVFGQSPLNVTMDQGVGEYKYSSQGIQDPNKSTDKDQQSLLIPYGPHDDDPPGQSPVIVAILKQHQGILEKILKKKKEWIHLKDDKGRTALHYAASIGYVVGVNLLLENGFRCNEKSHHGLDSKECISYNIIRDKEGFCALHLASASGYVGVVKILLKHCLDPRQLLDNYGRNIVHIATQMGRFNVVKYILKHPKCAKMINDIDCNGNTPLHLATLNCHPKIVHALTWDNRVDLTLGNRENKTALDVYMQFPQENPSLRQRLIKIALESAGVKQYAARESQSINVPPPPHSAKNECNQEGQNNEASKKDPYKDRINTLMLVSTLITTVTFAAGFTLPGGTNSSDPGQGMAVMLNYAWFKLFIFCITISMYGAVSATILLIWAQLGDITLTRFALKVTMPLLGITLVTLSVAFLAGVHLVISDLSWLATTILVLCVIFIFILSLLYILLWFFSSSSNPLYRFIFYYPFRFLTWLVEQGENEAGFVDSSLSANTKAEDKKEEQELKYKT